MDGVQLKAIQREAQKHPNLKWFWIDFTCMPQEIKDEHGEVTQGRTELEQQYFDSALTGVNVLYLFMDVYIVVDLDYMHRFWCLLVCRVFFVA